MCSREHSNSWDAPIGQFQIPRRDAVYSKTKRTFKPNEPLYCIHSRSSLIHTGGFYVNIVYFFLRSEVWPSTVSWLSNPTPLQGDNSVVLPKESINETTIGHEDTTLRDSLKDFDTTILFLFLILPWVRIKGRWYWMQTRFYFS